MTSWMLNCLGLPDTIRQDRGVQFMVEHLQQAAVEVDVKCLSVGVKAPSSMGLGERLHGPIRKIYENVRRDFPDVEDLDYL